MFFFCQICIPKLSEFRLGKMIFSKSDPPPVNSSNYSQSDASQRFTIFFKNQREESYIRRQTNRHTMQPKDWIRLWANSVKTRKPFNLLTCISRCKIQPCAKYIALSTSVFTLAFAQRQSQGLDPTPVTESLTDSPLTKQGYNRLIPY